MSYFIFVRKACVFHARLLNDHFFWLKTSLFWCLCLFFCVAKEPKNTSLARSPALAYAVRISQDGTRIKFEELMPVRLSNRCKLILVRRPCIYFVHDTGRCTRRQSIKDTRETRAGAKMAFGVKTWCAHYDDCLTNLEWIETARSLDTDLKSYVGTISLFTCFTISWQKACIVVIMEYVNAV